MIIQAKVALSLLLLSNTESKLLLDFIFQTFENEITSEHSLWFSFINKKFDQAS